MNAEFHYWIVLYVAKKAGIGSDEAEQIAYASQLVDDRTSAVVLRKGGGETELLATQCYSNVDSEPVRLARMAFHFVPGDTAEASRLRSDRSASRLAATPGSPLARKLLTEALKSKNPYRIGIAAHAYADTWAHANFSAALEKANSFDPDDPVPPLGHAAALKRPDLLNEQWTDPRLVASESAIDNRERFAAAARMLYKFFATYAGRGFGDVDAMEHGLRSLWGIRGMKGRRERYLDYALATGAEDYDKDAWTRAAGLGILSASLGSGASGVDSSLAGKLLGLASKGKDMLMNSLNLTIEEPRAFSGSRFAAWNEAALAHLGLFDSLFTNP